MEIKEMTKPKLDEILALYESVGWMNYVVRSEILESAFENSLLTLGAYDGSKLVGLIRTVGDGYSIVFIQDILILPNYQHQGIGTNLVKNILERFGDVYQIELFTDNTPKTLAFYRSLGFENAADIGCCGFIRM